MTESTTQLLGVVVVNYGSHDLLESNLASFDADAIPATVVVVDNFTSTEELSAVRSAAQRRGWTVCASERNVGFGAAANLGAARAAELGCDAFLLLNPDAVVSADTARELAALTRRHPRSLVSPLIRRPDGSIWFRGSSLDLSSGRVGAVKGAFSSGPRSWLTGACLAASRDFWGELGGFADGYFLYWEDLDLSYRCVAAGGELMLAEALEAVHDAHGTQRSVGRAKSGTYYYYNARNRLLFASRLLPTRQLLGWLWRTPTQTWEILLRGGRRQFLRSPRAALSGIRGMLVGIAIAAKELAARAVHRSSGDRTGGDA